MHRARRPSFASQALLESGRHAPFGRHLRVDCGVDPNYQHPEFGTTPLIAAAEAGQVRVVRALLEAGADHRMKAHWDGGDALEAARANGHEALVAVLMAAGTLRRR